MVTALLKWYCSAEMVRIEELELQLVLTFVGSTGYLSIKPDVGLT